MAEQEVGRVDLQMLNNLADRARSLLCGRLGGEGTEDLRPVCATTRLTLKMKLATVNK